MDKNVFCYEADGAKKYADPMRLNRELWNALDGRFQQYLDDARSDDNAKAFAAHEKLLAAARDVFGLWPEVDPQTGEGFTEEECFGVLGAFLDYAEKKNPSAVNSPTSSPSATPPTCFPVTVAEE